MLPAHYVFSILLMTVATESALINSREASESTLAMHKLLRRGSGGMRRRIGFKSEGTPYKRLSENSPSRSTIQPESQDIVTAPLRPRPNSAANREQVTVGLANPPSPVAASKPPSRSSSHSKSSSSLSSMNQDPAPVPGRKSSDSRSARDSTTAPPGSSSSGPTLARDSPGQTRRLYGEAKNWGPAVKVAVASIEAQRTLGPPYFAYTKTPVKKNDHIGNSFLDEPYVVHHLDKASAGGSSPAGGRLRATAQGRWIRVGLDMHEGARGYVAPFYGGTASPTRWFGPEDGKDGKLRINLLPDADGRRMGVVAGMLGEGTIKVKGTNHPKVQQQALLNQP